MDIPLWLTIILQILLQLVLIMLNAIFACAEIAVIETKGTKLDSLAESGNKKARRLKKLTDQPAKFLATIQVAITLSGFLGSAFASDNFSVYIVNGLHGKTPLSDGAIKTISVIVITVILSYITLIFGELVPKRLAMKNSEAISLGLSGPINCIAICFKPLVWLLTVSTNGVLRMLGIDPDSEDSSVSEEDIRLLADAGSENGTIGESENEMIQNIFEFDDITVGEISTHRTEMTVLWCEDGDSVWEDTIQNDIHSYYPICGENIDNIIGVLDAKKYLRLSDRSRASVMAHAVEKPRFATEVMKADALFREMKGGHFTVAIVVDEYGGTSGLVTLNDLIEQIVGNLDESADAGDIKHQGDGYLISGLAERERVDELFDIDTGSDSATVGGWVMEKLEKIPEAGDTFDAEGVTIKVVKADQRRVIEVYAEKSKKEAAVEE